MLYSEIFHTVLRRKVPKTYISKSGIGNLNEVRVANQILNSRENADPR